MTWAQRCLALGTAVALTVVWLHAQIYQRKAAQHIHGKAHTLSAVWQ